MKRRNSERRKDGNTKGDGRRGRKKKEETGVGRGKQRERRKRRLAEGVDESE